MWFHNLLAYDALMSPSPSLLSLLRKGARQLSVTYPVVAWGPTQGQSGQCRFLCTEPAFLEKRSLGWISLEHHHSQPSLLLLLPGFWAFSPSQVFRIGRSTDLSLFLPPRNAVHLGRDPSGSVPAGCQNEGTVRASDSDPCHPCRPGDRDQICRALPSLCRAPGTSRAGLVLSFTAHESKRHLRHGQWNSIFYGGLLHF